MWQRISSFIIFCYSYTVHCLGCGKHKTQSISCKTPTQTYAFLCLYQCISAAHKLITTTTLAQWITIHSHLFVILIHRRKTEWETLKADARPTNPWQIICESMCALFPKSFPPFFFFCISGNQTDLSLWVADDRVTCEGWARKKKKKRKKIWIYFKMQIIITEVSRRSIILGRWSAPSSSSCTHTYTERERGGGVLLVAFLVTQLVMANTQKKYRMEPHRKINLS